jgi:phospholipase C
MLGRTRFWLVAAVLIVGVGAAGVSASGAATSAPVGPIQHVVIIYEENHSFDNLLGALCVQLSRCDGTTTGVVRNSLGNDISFAMQASPDLVPSVGHSPDDQVSAIDGGRMDGWPEISGCSANKSYACVTQYAPSQIPNVASLASSYVISDHTFEPAPSASWGSHLELAASTLDGFDGNNPSASTGGVGWGCDSKLTTSWQDSPGGPIRQVPSCVPNKDGTGAFEPTPVAWVPTIMDRLQNAHLSWRIYASPRGESGYGWAICPTFADCLDSSESTQQVDNTAFASDAEAGHLPAFSIVTPTAPNSEHNTRSMTVGDNWVGAQVKAIMSGSDWSSTAIFLVWDDCGCFYDHVSPPSGEGIRVPVVIVSPFAKAAYDDPTPATLDSLLAFTEHAFGLRPLTQADANAYDYSNSFTVPISPNASGGAPVRHAAVNLTAHRLTPADLQTLRTTRPDPDDDT